MYETLSKSPFFIGLNPRELEDLFSRISHTARSFSRGQTIAQRDDEVRNLVIVLEGSVKGEMVDFSGKILKIEEINVPHAVAPAFLFGERNRYPVDVVALEDCKLLFVSRSDVLRLLQSNTIILSNYLNAIASRAQFLTGKLWFLSFRTIKEKVAHYLLNLAKSQSKTTCLLYTSPSPRDRTRSRMPSSA